jgi:extracellular factor (EF) 3-hydroxypalmitic acid methyl ester biosynthesis protein
MKHHVAFVKKLVKNGGPDSSDYHEIAEWLKIIHADFINGKLNKEDIQILRDEMGEALSILTVQGFVYCKPHGYAGDYEIIEKIYLEHVSSDPDLRKWDLYFQLQKAPIAVRNRKQYFISLLNALDALDTGIANKHVLNVASGPARDLFEFYSQKKDRSLVFDNVEYDPLAISYAKNLCKNFLESINFLHTNAFDFSAEKKYRLIWSAGMFDYLNDKKFIFLLKSLASHLEEDGELVVGNFSTDNPTLPYMEVVGEWKLYHRTSEQLVLLAKACGFTDGSIRIGQEPEGVNLFLHMKCGKDFIN